MVDNKTLCCVMLWLGVIVVLLIVLLMLFQRRVTSNGIQLPYKPLPTGCEIITGVEGFANTLAISENVFVEAGYEVNVYERNMSTGLWDYACSLINSDSQPGRDGFANGANPISISTDNKTIVVGARSLGSAYVFERPGSSWVGLGTITEVRRLTPSSGRSASLLFGWSVEIEDGSTIVIGAMGYANHRGLVYVFERPGASWGGAGDLNEIRQLTGSDLGSTHMFGANIFLQGTTIAVSKRGYVGRGIQGGGYVFERPGTTWAGSGQLLENRMLRLSTADTIPRVIFGRIIIDGDTIAVSEKEHASYTGQILMFERDGSTWGSGNEAPLTESRVLLRSGNQRLAGPFAFNSGVLMALDGSASPSAISVFYKPGDTWAGDGILTESFVMETPPSIIDNVSSTHIYYDGFTLAIRYSKIIEGDEDDEPGYVASRYLQLCT